MFNQLNRNKQQPMTAMPPGLPPGLPQVMPEGMPPGMAGMQPSRVSTPPGLPPGLAQTMPPGMSQAVPGIARNVPPNATSNMPTVAGQGMSPGLPPGTNQAMPRNYPDVSSEALQQDLTPEGQMEKQYLNLLLSDYLKKNKLNSPIPNANIEQNKDIIAQPKF